jgi:hypothetical protein
MPVRTSIFVFTLDKFMMTFGELTGLDGILDRLERWQARGKRIDSFGRARLPT